MAAKDSTQRTGVYFNEEKGRYRVSFGLKRNGVRVRRSKLLPTGITLDEAHAIAESMRASAFRELSGLEPNSGWLSTIRKASDTKGSWFHEMLWRARQRGREKGCAFRLTRESLTTLLIRSDGRCEVTGVAFSDRAAGRGRMRPLVPSLDRIIPVNGYTEENCRIVCAAINVAMFTWGEELFKSLAIGYLINRIIAPHAPIFANSCPSFYPPAPTDFT
jgi:hypothetical protein